MENIILKWHISDYDGRRTGKEVVFQNKTMTLCKRLTSWIRLDNYLVKWHFLLWFCGYNGIQFLEEENKIDELLKLFISHVGSEDVYSLAKKAEEYTRDNKLRWFHSQVHHLSKKEADEVEEYQLMRLYG